MGLWTVLALGIGSYLLRAVGLALAGSDRLPGWAERPLRLVPPAILAALVVGLLSDASGRIRWDESLVGVLVGVVLLRLRAPLAVAMLCAAAVTAILRSLG